ncbi:MAG: polyprenyl synthetase family protein [Lentisphaeria bacterium]|nr:polyprenyl synthetase family protein [Candidatus Neomarinimicrobiota bacterium]MCF7843064.1 polyprenyl synthetase family protein [Lentisphaeria bacterium]
MEARLQQAPFPTQPAYLYEPIRYALAGKGKRLRPAFVFASAEAVGGHWREVLNVAAAVEVFHLFSLVHDDIMDNDEMRRGRAAVHHAFDTNRALLSGDALLIYAYEQLADVPAPLLPPVLTAFNRHAMAVCEGQAWDMQFEHEASVAAEDYDRMIDAKTGALLQLSAYLGGLAGGGTEEQAQRLGEIALLTGRAFQMQDDLLEVTSSSTTMGKSLGSDVIHEKKTWLWLDLWKHLSPAALSEWEAAKSNPEIGDAERLELVRNWMQSTGTLERAEMRINQWIEKANEQIRMGGFRETDTLEALLNVILHRKS